MAATPPDDAAAPARVRGDPLAWAVLRAGREVARAIQETGAAVDRLAEAVQRLADSQF